MISRLTPRKLQAWHCFERLLASQGWLEHVQVGEPGQGALDDRCLWACDDELESLVRTSGTFAEDPCYLKSDHPGAYASFRQAESFWAAQLTFVLVDGARMVDVDCDRGRPFYDLAGWAVHGAEVAWHKLSGAKTSPWDVRKHWNDRGLQIPLITKETLNA